MNLTSFMCCRRLLSFTVFLASTLAQTGFALDAEPLKNWVQAQGKIQSLSGSFSQERKLKVLRKTLVAPGRFWYAAPDQFRWDIGEPLRRVAIQSRDKVTVIDVEKGKAQIEADDTSRMAGYMQLSFPRDWESFQRQFRVLSLQNQGGVLLAELQPLDLNTARGVRTISFEIDPVSYATTAFILRLKDGSEMRTSFTSVKRDVPLPPSTFEVSLEGLRVKEKGI